MYTVALMMTREEMDRLADEIIASQNSRISTLATAWRADHDGPRHFEILSEDDHCSIYLLGWRPGEEVTDHIEDSTPIHGHGLSAVSVCVLKGETDNEAYGQLESMTLGQSIKCEKQLSILRPHQRVFLPAGLVHDMRCDEKEGRTFSLTLHVYSPRLTHMTYYEPTSDGLRFTSTWEEQLPTMERTKSHV